jgi:hypothetical protein
MSKRPASTPLESASKRQKTIDFVDSIGVHYANDPVSDLMNLAQVSALSDNARTNDVATLTNQLTNMRLHHNLLRPVTANNLANISYCRTQLPKVVVCEARNRDAVMRLICDYLALCDHILCFYTTVEPQWKTNLLSMCVQIYNGITSLKLMSNVAHDHRAVLAIAHNELMHALNGNINPIRDMFLHRELTPNLSDLPCPILTDDFNRPTFVVCHGVTHDEGTCDPDGYVFFPSDVARAIHDEWIRSPFIRTPQIHRTFVPTYNIYNRFGIHTVYLFARTFTATEMAVISTNGYCSPDLELNLTESGLINRFKRAMIDLYPCFAFDGVPMLWFDEALDNVIPARRSGEDYTEYLARLHNSLMHALNGNTDHKRRDNRAAFHRAFIYDPFDPLTCKFDEADAHAYVKSHSDHHFVLALGADKVVKFMLKRRGVKTSAAFKLAYNHYVCTKDIPLPPQLDLPTRVITYPTLVRDDAGPALERAIAALDSGDHLTRGQRSLLNKFADLPVSTHVIKKSGFSFLPKIPAMHHEHTHTVDDKTAAALADALSGIDKAASVVNSASLRATSATEKIVDAAKDLSDTATTLSRDVTSTANKMTDSVTTALDKVTAAATKITTSSVVDAGAAAVSAVFDIDNALRAVGISETNIPFTRKLFKALRDFMAVYNSSLTGRVAVLTLLAESKPATYVAGIAACSLLMDQLTKWVSPAAVEKKDFGDLELPASIFGPFINFLTQHVLGIQKPLQVANTTFTFAKNLSTTAEFIGQFVKTALNWIWTSITGYPLICSVYDATLRDIELICKDTEAGLRLPPNAEVFADCRAHIATLRVKIATIATSAPKDVLQKYKARLEWYDSAITAQSTPLQYTDTRNRPVLVTFHGESQIGKTMLIGLCAVAIGKARKWHGDHRTWTFQYKLGTNSGFLPKLPPHTKVLQIDEMFNQEDPIATGDEAAQLLRLISSVPMQEEGASVDAKELHVRPDVVFASINKAPASYGIINPEAIEARVDYSFEITLKPGVYDVYKAIETLHPDQIFTFTYTGKNQVPKTDFNFTEVCSLIIGKCDRYTVGSRAYDVAAATILRDFNPVPVTDLPRPGALLVKDTSKAKPPKPKFVATRFHSELETDDAPLGAKMSYIPKLSDHQTQGPVLAPVFLSPSTSSPSTSHVIKKISVTERLYADAIRTNNEDMTNVPTLDEINTILEGYGDDEVYDVESDIVKFCEITNTHVNSTMPRALRAILIGGSAPRPNGHQPKKFMKFQNCDCMYSRETAQCLVHEYGGHESISCAVTRVKLTKAGVPLEDVNPNLAVSYLVSAGIFVGRLLYDVISTGLYCAGLVLMVVGAFAAYVLFCTLLMIATSYLVDLIMRVLAWIFPTMVVPKAYLNDYAIQRPTEVSNKRMVLPINQPVSQRASFAVMPRPGRTDSVNATMEKITVAAIFVTNLTDRFSFGRIQLQAINGRLCSTVRHVLHDGQVPTGLLLPPPYNKYYAVSPVFGFNENLLTEVQLLPAVDRDFMYVLLPVGLNLFPDVTDKYLYDRDLNPGLLTDCMVYHRKHSEVRVENDQVVSGGDKLPLLNTYFGNFLKLTVATYQDGQTTPSAEFFNSCNVEDGVCGGAVVPMNSRVGDGKRMLGITVCGYSERSCTGFAILHTREDLDNLYAAFPWLNRLIKIVDNAEFQRLPHGGPVTKKSAIGIAPRPGFLPHDPGIQPSLIFNALGGAVLAGNTVPDVVRVPSKMTDTEEAFSKYPPFIPEISEDTAQDLIECAIDLSHSLIDASKHYKLRRTSFLTRHEALNGTPEGDVKAINDDSSAGYSFSHNATRTDKLEYFDLKDGVLSLKPQWEEEANDLFNSLFSESPPSTFHMSASKTTPKGELRNSLGSVKPDMYNLYSLPVKVSRLTSCQHALLLLEMRRVFAPIQAMIAFGAPLNGTARGVDPTGPSGDHMWRRLLRHLKKICIDAKKFDASQLALLAYIIGIYVFAPMLKFIYPWLTDEQSVRYGYIIALYSRLGYEIFGLFVYLHIDGNISGCLATTDINDCTSGILIRLAWLWFHRRTGRTDPVWTSFHSEVVYSTQGDDMAATTDSEFNAFDLKLAYNAVNIEVTNSSKDAITAPYDDQIEFLKRTPVSFHGKMVGILPLLSVNETLSYIRTKVMTKEEATTVNADSALIELVMYDRAAYESGRSLINLKLLNARCSPVRLTFDDQLNNWKAKFGEAQQVIKKCATSAISRVTPLASVLTHPGCTRYTLSSIMAVLLLCTMFNPTSCNMNRISDSSSSIGGTATVTVSKDGTDNLSAPPPLVDTVGLTKHMDEKVGIKEDANNALPGKELMFNPYPDQNVATVLSREYLVDTFDWLPTDVSTDEVYRASFPEKLFTIPKVAETLASFRYLRSAVKVRVKINGNPFVSGRLMLSCIPGTDFGTWRDNFFVRSTDEHLLLSASSSESAEMVIPWINPMSFKDLGDSTQKSYTGIFFIHVLHPCAQAASVALSRISVAVYASFIDPIVAGLDLNALAMDVTHNVSKRSGIGAVFKTAESAVKDAKGILTGAFKSADSIVGTLMEVGAQLAPLAAMLDKPNEQHTTQPMVIRSLPDLVYTTGEFSGITLASRPDARVSTDADLLGTDDPTGNFLNLVKKPGLLLTSTITTTDNVGDSVMGFPVRPNYAFVTAGRYRMHPLAYFSQFFRYWRGDLKYKFIISCSPMQSCQVRISFMPSVNVTTPPPENQSGDIVSTVLTISGDTEYDLVIPFISGTMYKRVAPIDVANNDLISSIGRITMSVVSPITTAPGSTVPIYISVYVAAGDNFQLLFPDPFYLGWSPITTTGVSKKSSISQLFKKPFQSVIPVKSVAEKSICTPDAVTSVAELSKRFEAVVLSTAGYESVHHPVEVSQWHRNLALPFLHYRGGYNAKVVPYDLGIWNGTYTALSWTPEAISTDPVQAESDFTLTGSTFSTKTSDFISSVNFPAYDMVTCREVTPTLVGVPAHQQANFSTDSTAGSLIVYTACGDDYSIGRFAGCPSFKYVAPPVDVRYVRSHPSAVKVITTGPTGGANARPVE